MTRKIDMEKLPKEILTPDGKRLIKPSVDWIADSQIEAIAATMLKQTETIEIMKNLPEKQCPRCNPNEWADAARKGDRDE